MKKRVFSLDKFREDAETFMVGDNLEKVLELAIDGWAEECNGLTDEEMRERDNAITMYPEWTIEVDA